jgi:hypothetical protein
MSLPVQLDADGIKAESFDGRHRSDDKVRGEVDAVTLLPRHRVGLTARRVRFRLRSAKRRGAWRVAKGGQDSGVFASTFLCVGSKARRLCFFDFRQFQRKNFRRRDAFDASSLWIGSDVWNRPFPDCREMPYSSPQSAPKRTFAGQVANGFAATMRNT